MNNSHSFLTEQAFLIAIPATAVIKPLTFRACFGHAATHRIHEIHLLLSVILGFFLSIAPAGHLSAHKPQPEHEAFAFGISVSAQLLLYTETELMRIRLYRWKIMLLKQVFM